MTLNDFLKRVSEDDKDKMLIFREGEGWSNVNVQVNKNEITITCDDNAIFSDDK